MEQHALLLMFGKNQGREKMAHVPQEKFSSDLCVRSWRVS